PGAAVHTLIVTTVGNGDPQVRDCAPEFVVKKQALSSWPLALGSTASASWFGLSQKLRAKSWFRKQTGGTIPAAVSFPIRSSRSAGGAGVSTSTLGKFPPRALRLFFAIS